jgi:LmbE family N-acetylglucosaminyl deacetylase
MTAGPAFQHLPEDWHKALAVAAHPDDLEFGAASAVAKWTSQGKEVVYLLATRGEAGINGMAPEEAGQLREEEERNSAAVVDVKTVEFLNHKDGVIEYGPGLRKDIAAAIRRHKPEVVIAFNFRFSWGPGTLNSADHRAVGLATLDAVSDAGNRWIFPELASQGLEPWGKVKMVCVAGSPEATHGVDVSDYIERGIASLREHKVYLENLGDGFDAASFIKGYAADLGSRLGCSHAVSFEVFFL